MVSESIHKLENKIGSPFWTQMTNSFNKYVLDVWFYAKNYSWPSSGETANDPVGKWNILADNVPKKQNKNDVIVAWERKEFRI